ncbi:MAG: hypothetical protein PHE84_10030 [bacterium]|nr:hypothetical protein [bacterium]
MSKREASVVIGVIGFLWFFLGGMIGFLIRPSVPLVGKLSFNTVLARGENLDVVQKALLGPTAHASFNLMMECALIGLVGGLSLGILIWFLVKKRG